MKKMTRLKMIRKTVTRVTTAIEIVKPMIK